MNTTRLNDYLVAQDSQTINFNKEIIVNDLEGNSKIVVKCYCTIQGGKSISYYMTVEEEAIFENNKSAIQSEIEKFKQESIELATRNNVPII